MQFSMIVTDIAELNLPKTCQLDFPDPDDLLNFKLIISPDEVSTVSRVAKVVCTLHIMYFTVCGCKW
jgi:hypothetical protein